MDLTEEQIIRYSRNIALKEMGGIGQRKLLASRVLIIGAGGLGSPVLSYLAAAGVGHIGIVDNDTIHESNLNRQIVHSFAKLNVTKVESAKTFINDLNPDVKVKTYHTRLTIKNALELIQDYDCVVDCVDTLPLKFLINDACVEAKIPFFHAGIVGLNGQLLTVIPGESACLKCLFPEDMPDDFGPTCAQAGVLGACVGVLGSLQAAEVIKYLLGLNVSKNRLLVYDGISSSFKTIEINKNDSCPVCVQSKMLPIEHYEITKTFCD